MKGVPHHGAGARPAPTAQAREVPKVRFDGVRVGAAPHGFTHSTAVQHGRSAEASGLGQSPEGFSPRVFSARPRPSPALRLSHSFPKAQPRVQTKR